MKASKGLLLAGGIIGLISAVVFAFEMVISCSFVALAGLMNIGIGIYNVIQYGGDMGVHISSFVFGGVYLIMSLVLAVYGVVAFIVLLVGPIIILVARKKQKKGLYIAAIVFAGITLVFFNSGLLSIAFGVLTIVGAALGLKSRKEEQLPEDELQPEEASEVAE